jgi:LysM repeat protein
MLRKLSITALCGFILWRHAAAQNPVIIRYINSYKFIAIKEMQRTGIPASITLAQGILETQAGCSDLVKSSNNHFGIKCKNTWLGDKVYHDDDEKGECFRAYSNAEDSYRDHSDFLKNSPRYAFLFKIAPEDYQGWAKGLKKAGYATNPKYPQQLNKYIEDYDLQVYTLIAQGKKSISDESPMYARGDNMTATQTAIVQNTAGNPAAATSRSGGPLPETSYPEEMFEINNTKVLYAKQGSSLLAIAEQYDIRYSHLLDFNELPSNEDILPADQLLYLQRKRKQGQNEYHVALTGETFYDIAQREGVRLESVLSYNHTSEATMPQEGQKIYLQKEAPAEREVVLAGNEVARVQAPREVSRAKLTHVVGSKETLFSIAKKYDVNVEQLKTWNSLQKNDIRTGQELVIYKN